MKQKPSKCTANITPNFKGRFVDQKRQMKAQKGGGQIWRYQLGEKGELQADVAIEEFTAQHLRHQS